MTLRERVAIAARVVESGALDEVVRRFVTAPPNTEIDRQAVLALDAALAPIVGELGLAVRTEEVSLGGNRLAIYAMNEFYPLFVAICRRDVE